MRALLVTIAVACACALFSRGAFAQPSPEPPVVPALKDMLTGAALEAYESAHMLLDHGDFPGAMAKFQQAYGLSSDPRLLFDMAVCAREMRSYARMQNLLLRYEQEGKSLLSTDSRNQVDAALAAIRNLVGLLTITVSEPGALLSIDGDPVGVSPLAVPLAIDLGIHTVLVSKEGFDPAERRIDVVGGREDSLSLTLVARARPAQLLVLGEAGASIVVDHRDVARDRFDAIVPAGMHLVQVSAPGKKTYETEVELHDGETRSLQISLEDEARGPSAWPWIVGGVVAVAGASVGGYFLFRQQPTETPLTGTLGTVVVGSH